MSALDTAGVGAVALATVGTQLDEVRIERDDLEFETSDLQQSVDALTTERTDLQRQAEEQLKAIEQLKGELERLRQNTPASTPANP